MMISRFFLIDKAKGYTLVELMVALAVSSIVIAGSYAGYGMLAQQQKLLDIQTSEDRNALRVIDLIQSDIRMAGYTAPNDVMQTKVVLMPNPLAPTTNELIVVYDDYNSDNTLYRALIHYSLEQYVSSVSGLHLFKLRRDWRSCSLSVVCDLSSSTSKYTDTSNGQVILDSVLAFNVTGQNPKSTAISYLNEFQSIQIGLQVTSPDKVEKNVDLPAKSFNFFTRVMNVSLVP